MILIHPFWRRYICDNDSDNDNDNDNDNDSDPT
jgi:hypothetical protein